MQDASRGNPFMRNPMMSSPFSGNALNKDRQRKPLGRNSSNFIMPEFVDRKSLLPEGYSATETKTKESSKKVDEPKKTETTKQTPSPTQQTVKPEIKPATPQTPKLFDLNEINRKF